MANALRCLAYIACLLVASQAVAGGLVVWGPYHASYVRNYDGDTVTADLHIYPGMTLRENLRVTGIDTPEIGGCEPEKALEAKEFTRAFVQDGFTVKILGKGKYGRPLVEITAGGRDLGEALMSEGLARPYSERWC